MRAIRLRLPALLVPALALLLASCATTTALPEGVEFRNNVYYIPNEGVDVNGRNAFKLKPGDYMFATIKPGHRLRIHPITIENRDARRIKVEPGPGFAVADFTFTPAADAVLIVNAESPDAAGIGLDPPWRVQLDIGRYRVAAEAEGHLPLTETFEILPNQPVHLDLQFVAKPTSAPLLVTTKPPGAELFLDGKRVGEAPKSLKAVPFGTRRITAYIYANADYRKAFEGEVDFGPQSPPSIELRLNAAQRRFEGEWYAQAEANRLYARRAERLRRAEENAYRSARIEDALELRFPLPALADKEDTTEQDFAAALFMLLRVGDRVRVDLDGTEHLVWKRSAQIGGAFRRQVSALWNDTPVALQYDVDPAQIVDIRPERRLITTVAYYLHRQLNDCPILDLGAAMHDLEGISVHAPAEDGDVTVLTFGGRDLTVNGRRIEAAGQFGFQRLDASAQTLHLTWTAKPQRILIVSSRNALTPPWPGGPLALAEKRLLDLGVNGRVQAFHSFTRHPGGHWRHARTEPGSLPSVVEGLDFNKLAIGPHDVAGEYTREWLVHYETPSGDRATRQIPVDYRVDDAVEPADPGEFIRHDD